jgi:hypothetical protein
LCDHSQWRVHSHGITRDVAQSVLKLRIDHPESIPQFERALRRLWALLHWLFEHTIAAKVVLSQHYALFRNRPALQLQPQPPGATQ